MFLPPSSMGVVLRPKAVSATSIMFLTSGILSPKLALTSWLYSPSNQPQVASSSVEKCVLAYGYTRCIDLGTCLLEFLSRDCLLREALF